YGGPFIGGLAALLCFGIAYFLPESLPEAKELLFALAHVGFLINLFNLIPIPPMDGGRITAALSRWFWILGWIVSLGWFILGNYHPILLIILFVGGVQIFKTFWKKEEDVDKSYYNIDPTTRFYIAAAYFSLVMALSYMSFFTNDLLEHLRQF
ncbi:MAG: site-2 protease family protein, partial [Cyanobacteria bacterium]|nr:site-2 protease family protein [Cyanobacteriota bacterium]